MSTPSPDPRSEVRAFGASLIVVVQGLFFGALFFTYVYRRSHAEQWRAAWEHIDGAAGVLAATLVFLFLTWGAYAKGRPRLSAAFAFLAAITLVNCALRSSALMLPNGSRAASIALFASSILFAVQAILLGVMGILAKGNPVFARFLLFQLVAALLMLPVIFVW